MHAMCWAYYGNKLVLVREHAYYNIWIAERYENAKYWDTCEELKVICTMIQFRIKVTLNKLEQPQTRW